MVEDSFFRVCPSLVDANPSCSHQQTTEERSTSNGRSLVRIVVALLPPSHLQQHKITIHRTKAIMRIIDYWWKITPLLLLSQRQAVVFSFGPSSILSNSRTKPTVLNDTPKDNLSASSRARREEDERRLQRKDDVVIGKTSAKRGAKDFALDPKSTEEKWMRQASRLEQQVFKLTEEGMQAFKMVREFYYLWHS